MRKYGITRDEYDRLLVAQNGRCLICNRPGDELKKGLAVDHDHETGAVRGLLCVGCNTKLGWLERYFEIILDYIRRPAQAGNGG